MKHHPVLCHLLKRQTQIKEGSLVTLKHHQKQFKVFLGWLWTVRCLLQTHLYLFYAGISGAVTSALDGWGPLLFWVFSLQSDKASKKKDQPVSFEGIINDMWLMESLAETMDSTNSSRFSA